MFFSAIAACTGCPPKVIPCANIAPCSVNGSITDSLAANGADRRVGRRQALGHRQQVRFDVVALRGEPLADAPEARDHLVGAQQDAVAVAQLARTPAQ